MAEPLLAEQTESILVRDFGAWMTSEQRRIYGLCQRFLQDRDEADSATQDVFLKAYQALIRQDAKELDDPARWVTRIAVNTCLDRLRRTKLPFWRWSRRGSRRRRTNASREKSARGWPRRSKNFRSGSGPCLLCGIMKI
jgi:DNA-directed RNA polymerase specialized sigma24 family protein